MIHDHQVMFEKLFSKKGLSFDRLRALVELKESGSLVAAAGGDAVRQSQYSRQIKELEEFFGTELTRRRGKGIELTEGGQRLVRLAGDAFASLADFQAECEGLPMTIRLGAGDSLLQWLVLPSLSGLQERLPKTEFVLSNLRTAEIARGLSEGSLDLGLVWEAGLPRHLKKHRLFQLNYSVFAPKARLPRRAVDDRWVFENLPVAVHNRESRLIQDLCRTAKEKQIPLSVRLWCESLPQTCRAVASGDYAAVLPSIAATDLDPKRFAELPLTLFKPEKRAICLAWNQRLLDLRPAAEQVLRVFKDGFAGMK